MKNAGHDESIAKVTFLLVCSGETYSAEIVKGPELLDKMLEAQFGKASEASASERQFWKDEIDEPDNWCSDRDCGPTHYETDIGETDRIRIYLITEKP